MQHVNEQSRAEGLKNVEVKADAQQPPIPSASPLPEKHRPKVYVAGDGTSVVFSHLTAPDDSQHPGSMTSHEARVAGAKFVRDVLHELCKDELEVEATELVGTGNRGACRAVLKQFGDRHRIDRYEDGHDDSTPKAQCVPTFREEVKGGGALVLYGLPDCTQGERRFHACLTEATRESLKPYLAAARGGRLLDRREPGQRAASMAGREHRPGGDGP